MNAPVNHARIRTARTSGRIDVRTGATTCLGTLPAPAPGRDDRSFDANGITVTLGTMRVVADGTRGVARAYFASDQAAEILHHIPTFRPTR